MGNSLRRGISVARWLAMYLHRMPYILIILGLLYCSAKALPSIEFISAFAVQHHRSNVVLHVPDEVTKYDCLKWSKELRTIQTAFSFHGTELTINQTFRHEELHVFLFDEKDFDSGVNKFKDLFNLRTWSSKEFWLVDIGHLTLKVPMRQLMNRIESTFEDLKLDLDDDLYLYSELQDVTAIWEIYSVHYTVPNKVRIVGEWTEDDGIEFKEPRKWIRRSDLEGVTLKFQSIHDPPGDIWMKKIPGTDEYEFFGILPEFWFALQEKLNFSYVLKTPEDGAWGAVNEDGSWSGMVGSLMNKECDVAISNFMVTLERSYVISPSAPMVLKQGTVLIIKNPSYAYNMGAYTKVFQTEAWMGTGIVCLLCSALLYMVTHIGHDKIDAAEYSIVKSLAFTLLSWRPRSYIVLPPIKLSSRIAFLSILFLGLFVFRHWKAALVGTLLVRKADLPFDGLESLLANSDYKVAVMPDSVFEDEIKFSNIPMWQKAWTERVEPNIDFYKEYYEGDWHKELDIVRDHPNIALYTWERPIDCEITELPRKHYSYTTTWALFQKDSPYLGLFNYFIHRLKENGVHQRVLKAPAHEISFEDKECPDITGQPIGFENCISAFLVLGTGVGTATLVMIAETLCKMILVKKSNAKIPSRKPITSESIIDNASIEVASVEDFQLE